MKQIKRILILSRVTRYCIKAVHAGVLLARKHGASLCVYHSTYDPLEVQGWTLPFSSTEGMMEEYRDVQESARQELAEVISREQADGLDIEVIVSSKDPDKEIFELVEQRGTDLLILRAHAENLIEHFFYGRSTDRIVRKLPCSVLLVKDEDIPL